MSVDLPPSECPQCGYKFNCCTVANVPGERVPEPGDLSLCIHCAATLVFTADMHQRLATYDDLVDLPIEHLKELVRAKFLLRERIAQKN